MKNRKVWFLSLLGIGWANVQAQVILQENFDAFIVGNLAPQMGISTLGGASSDYQVSNGINGRDVTIISGNTGQEDSNRLVVFPSISNAWDTRSQGNILQVTFDVFTQVTPNSKTYGGLVIHEIDGSERLECISLLYNADSRNLKIRYLNSNDEVQEEVVTAFNGQSVVLPENTWVRVGFAYDTDNASVTIKGPGFDKTFYDVQGFIDEVGLLVKPYDVSNTIAGLYRFDNIKVEVVEVENILSTGENTILENKFEVSPNPATEYIKLNLPEKIQKAFVYDISGRGVECAVETDNRISVKSLLSGIYFLIVETEKGRYTKKIIKQ